MYLNASRYVLSSSGVGMEGKMIMERLLAQKLFITSSAIYFTAYSWQPSLPLPLPLPRTSTGRSALAAATTPPAITCSALTHPLLQRLLQR